MIYRNKLFPFLILLLITAAVSPAWAVKCPKDMISVEGRYCVDRYEYPNLKGALPEREVPRENAAGICEHYGKRLCTTGEWTRACGGPDSQKYPHGPKYGKEKCNDASMGMNRRSSAGILEECTGPDGTHDMSGNLYEWAVAKNGNPVLMGGSYKTSDPATLSCSAM
ncbi:SUMF1/EgtB/PvdO family nonheme iron enzyme, partial [bacterium]